MINADGDIMVRCELCGEPMFAKSETVAGDMAWDIQGHWYCDDCAHALFYKEVEFDEPV